MQARYYDSNIGRFLNVDPAFSELSFKLEDPQSMNSYAYARNNPIGYIDPDGRFSMREMYDAMGEAIRYTDGLNDALSLGQWSHSMNSIKSNGEGLGVKLSNGQANPLDVAYSAVNATFQTLRTGAGALTTGLAVGELGMAAGVIPMSSAGRSTLMSNKVKGTAHETNTYQKLRKTNDSFVRELTVKTGSGTRTRLDIVGRDSSGACIAIECKSSAAARLTPNQSKAFPEILQSGATVVGKGKPGFPGGSTIGPTKVQIIRP